MLENNEEKFYDGLWRFILRYCDDFLNVIIFNIIKISEFCHNLQLSVKNLKNG
jgi:hypothetical protein